MENDLSTLLNKKIRNYQELKKITIKELADAIGIDPTTFSRKLRSKSRWNLEECELLLAIIDPELLDNIKDNYGKSMHQIDLCYMNLCIEQINQTTEINQTTQIDQTTHRKGDTPCR